MGFTSWTDKGIKGLNVWDIGLIKYSSMTVGLIIGAYISSFIKKHLKAFILLVILFSIKPMTKFFKQY